MSHTETEQNLLCNLTRIQEEPVLISNVAYTCTEHNNQDDLPWYFDSGCLRHMTGNQDHIEKLDMSRVEELLLVMEGKVKFEVLV